MVDSENIVVDYKIMVDHEILWMNHEIIINQADILIDSKNILAGTATNNPGPGENTHFLESSSESTILRSKT